jgi:hypothetical protein
VRLSTLLLLGCPASPFVLEPSECADEPPGIGEVRAKAVVCSSEIPADGEAKIGDWVIENSRVRFTVRNQPNRLTQLRGGGGTIIDAEVQGAGDAITELVPDVEGGWPTSTSISIDDGNVVVRDQDNPQRQWRYILEPDSSVLRLTDASGFTLVPIAGATLIGSWLHSMSDNHPLVIAGHEAPTDTGGWLYWAHTDRLVFGTSREVMGTLFEDSTLQVGTTEGEAIEVQLNGALLTRTPATDGKYRHEMPSESTIRAVSEGYTPGPWGAPEQGMTPPLGMSGFITVTVVDPDGTPAPATLTWNGVSYPVSVNGQRVPVGAGLGSGLITAGPEYLPVTIEEQSIGGDVEIDVHLEAMTTEAAWVAFDVPTFPGPVERRSTEDILATLSGSGVDYAVLTAADEVAQTSVPPDFGWPISYHGGSTANGPDGHIVAWPWSSDSKSAAHGAAPWHELSPIELFHWMSKAGRRFTAVDALWSSNTSQVSSLHPRPDAFLIRSPSELPQYTTLLDGWLAASLVGERTWVETTSRARTDVLRAILEGKTTPSTGPRLLFTVNGHGPGTNLAEWPDIGWSVGLAELHIEAPGDITQISLIGPRGNRLAEWPIEALPVTTSLPEVAWVIAMAEGESDWAITGPIWMQRP